MAIPASMNTTTILNNWEKRDNPDFPTELKEILEEADKETRPLANQKLVITVPRVVIYDNKEGWPLGLRDQGAEVYVVSMALDTSGRPGLDLSGTVIDKSGKVSQNKDASAEPVFGVATPEASKYLNVHRTPIFRGVKDGDALNLTGAGIVLYGPTAPQSDLVVIHGAIMESDGDHRKLGQAIEKAVKETKLNSILETVVELATLSSPQLKALKAAARLAYELTIFGLKENGDDVIGDFHGSYLRHKEWYAGTDTVFQRGKYLVDIVVETYR